MVRLVEITSEPAGGSKEVLLFRLIHGGLNDQEIAYELRGSQGFAASVKHRVCELYGLKSKEELSAFATRWCEANPLPVQQRVEVVRPPPGLGPFAVLHDKTHEFSCQHRIYLLPNDSDVELRRELLFTYIEDVISQYGQFNFTGGSTMNGQTVPGWDTLKKYWPRRILIGRRVEEVPSDSVEISYSYRRSKMPGMVRALYSWLDAQFTEHARFIFVKRPDSEELVYLEDLPKQEGLASSLRLQ